MNHKNDMKEIGHMNYNLHTFTIHFVKPSIPVKKYELSFATLARLLIKFGTRDYYKNLNL